MLLKTQRMPVPTEQQECRAYFQWAQLHPILKKWLIKLANEDKRHKVSIFGLYAIGFRKGTPDYILPVKTQHYGSFWLEMKRKEGYHVSIEQQYWIDQLKEAGNCAVVAHGFDEARQYTLDYLAGKLMD